MAKATGGSKAFVSSCISRSQSIAETIQKDLKQKSWRSTILWLSHCLSSTSFLKHPRLSCLGTVLPTVDCALP